MSVSRVSILSHEGKAAAAVTILVATCVGGSQCAVIHGLAHIAAEVRSPGQGPLRAPACYPGLVIVTIALVLVCLIRDQPPRRSSGEY